MSDKLVRIKIKTDGVLFCSKECNHLEDNFYAIRCRLFTKQLFLDDYNREQIGRCEECKDSEV